jgi:hypothetical protein
MDVVLLGVEFANLYLIETILKNIIYFIKLKIEFAVLGKLVHFVRDGSSGLHSGSAVERRGTSHGLGLEKPHSGASPDQRGRQSSASISGRYPDFVESQRLSGDVTHAEPLHDAGMEQRLASVAESWKERDEVTIGRKGEMWKNKGKLRRGS